MRRIMVELTPELAAAIDKAKGDRYRNPTLEEWLWSVPEVKAAARLLRLKRKPRPKPGPVPGSVRSSP